MTDDIYKQLNEEELKAIDNKDVFKLNNLIQKREQNLINSQIQKFENGETLDVFTEKLKIHVLNKMLLSIEEDLMKQN